MINRYSVLKELQSRKDLPLCYTNGFKIVERVEVKVAKPHFGLETILEHALNIFQAEMNAIPICVQECCWRDSKETKFNNVFLM